MFTNLTPTPRFFQDIFASFYRIWMVDGALERRDKGASNAFGFRKKYSKLRKCEPKNYHNVLKEVAKRNLEHIPLVGTELYR